MTTGTYFYTEPVPPSMTSHWIMVGTRRDERNELWPDSAIYVDTAGGASNTAGGCESWRDDETRLHPAAIVQGF